MAARLPMKLAVLQILQKALAWLEMICKSKREIPCIAADRSTDTQLH
jgi:hypothetical protein